MTGSMSGSTSGSMSSSMNNLGSGPPLGEGLVRELESQVREAQSQWHSPAVSAGVVRDGELVWSTHVGSARLDPISAPTDDTQYMIGSITKTFTAVLIMALRDAGRLSLDDRLETYPAADQTRRRHHPFDAGARLRPAARAGGPDLGEPRRAGPGASAARARGRRAGSSRPLRLPLLQPRVRAPGTDRGAARGPALGRCRH